MDIRVGMKGTFVSPYEQYAERNGQNYEVVKVFDEDDDEHDISEVGVMYRIRFDDGEEIEAWPEELFPPLSAEKVAHALKNIFRWDSVCAELA